MTFGTIALIISAYVVLAVLLLSLNIFSVWRWWVKVGAMVISGVFFIVTYFAIISLIGWPSPEQMPERFSLVASRVVEPDELIGYSGAIYLWVELLDENNLTSGLPRSYEIAYTSDLARTIEEAQASLDEGNPVEGGLETALEVDDATIEGSPEASGQMTQGAASAYETEGVNLVFNNLPPVLLPGKGPL